MAYIVGYPKASASSSMASYLLLVVVVATVLIGFMLYPLSSWEEGIMPAASTTLAIFIIMWVALNKLNPMRWKQIFHRETYERLIKADQKIISLLRTLTDRHAVMYDFNFELLHVNFLVLGPQGIFVISKMMDSTPVRIENGILMTGENSLQKQTSELWRICHLVNIVFKKGYNAEIMPQPILVSMKNEHPAIKKFDGISLVGPETLLETINNTADCTLPFEQIQGFTAYLEKRYFT